MDTDPSIFIFFIILVIVLFMLFRGRNDSLGQARRGSWLDTSSHDQLADGTLTKEEVADQSVAQPNPIGPQDKGNSVHASNPTKKPTDIKAELEAERNRRLMKSPPGTIREAIAEFRRRFAGSSFSTGTFGQEMSPLACFGYKAGKTGLIERERHEVLRYALWGVIPDFFPDQYKQEWGEPGTHKRYKKILDHLDMLVKRDQNINRLKVAVEHRASDRRWLYSQYNELMVRFRKRGLG